MRFNMTTLEEMTERYCELTSRKSDLKGELKEIDKDLDKVKSYLQKNMEEGYTSLPNGTFLTKTVRSGGGSFVKPWVKQGLAEAKDMRKVREHLARLKSVLREVNLDG